MRLNKRFVLDAVMVLCFGGLSVATPVQVHVPLAPVQAPHSIYVNVPVPGMLPAYLCDSPMKSSDCPEDTKGWEGSSEDGRVNR